jgi:hypothetical protein
MKVITTYEMYEYYGKNLVTATSEPRTQPAQLLRAQNIVGASVIPTIVWFLELAMRTCASDIASHMS